MKLYTVKSAAAALNICHATARRRIREGSLSCTEISGRYILTDENLNAHRQIFETCYVPTQVADILGRSITWIYQRIHSGELAAQKVGKCFWIPKEALATLEIISTKEPNSFSAIQVARMLDVSDLTVYRLIKAGFLPSYKIGMMRGHWITKENYIAFKEQYPVLPLLPPQEYRKKKRPHGASGQVSGTVPLMIPNIGDHILKGASLPLPAAPGPDAAPMVMQ